MSYECGDCGWTSGPGTDGAAMPEYGFGQENGKRVQVAHCPECRTILGTRENNLRAIGDRR